MRTFGKLLQVAGLVILPFAMVMQVTGGIRAPTGGFSVSAMLLLMLFGVLLFCCGRILEAYGQPR
jgi:hypothetical protein